MKLIAGERFRLHDDNIYIKLVSGKLEAYAVTRKKLPDRLRSPLWMNSSRSMC